ncbi:hypothetical protein CEXT_58931 [Caerostris extrusa]|uniref:Uncharacterized protein n=1 Tax=Caerostris extrusa TaxID=172846 RepID=A0AAV4QR86_CAEEX|nr:hypothetical protein CEXT_58931 [Caerostris extrusa]
METNSAEVELHEDFRSPLRNKLRKRKRKEEQTPRRFDFTLPYVEWSRVTFGRTTHQEELTKLARQWVPLSAESTQFIAMFQVGVTHLLVCLFLINLQLISLFSLSQGVSNFKIYPRHSLEQKILDFKCRNHLTIGEARRLYAQSSKTNYSGAAKINTTAPNIEEIVNQTVESIVQSITIKMEQQTTLLIEIFQKKQSKILCNIWSQYSTKLTSKNPPTESVK